MFDYGDHTLRAFSLNGNLEWTLDGPGGVPATFVNVSSLGVDRNRRIWTAEENPGRVSIIDRLGRVDKVLTGMPGIRRALPLSHDSYLALFPDSPLPRLYDSTGTLVRTVALPPPIETVSGLAGESWFATASNGRPVIAFIWSDRFVMLPADLRQARAYRGIERVDFPKVDELTVNIGGKAVESWRVDSSAVPAATSPQRRQEQRFRAIRRERGSANRFRILDTYSADSGSYLGSHSLPEPAVQVAIRGSTVVMLAPLITRRSVCGDGRLPVSSVTRPVLGSSLPLRGDQTVARWLNGLAALIAVIAISVGAVAFSHSRSPTRRGCGFPAA